MELDILTFLIVCPLTFAAGFVDAIAGGGGLISLPAFMLAGLPPHMAIGTNKVSSCMGTAVTTARFARSGFVKWRLAVPCACVALCASALGARTVLLVDATALTVFMLVVLPVTAAFVLRSRDLGEGRAPRPARAELAIALGASVAIGFYDGFYGPGTGTFLILLLVGLAHLELRQANGVTKVVNLSTNVAGAAVFLASGTVLLPLALAGGVFNIAGNWLGARLFGKRGAAVVRPLMLLVIGVFFVKVVADLLAMA